MVKDTTIEAFLKINKLQQKIITKKHTHKNAIESF